MSDENNIDKINKINEINKNITNLLEKYETNELIINKFHNYVVNQLPNILEHINALNEEKINKKQNLITQSEIFINKFLENNNYYYIPQSEYFIHYDNNNFNLINEDIIIQDIITNMRNAKENTIINQWTYKNKNTIIKKIKDKNIINCIPESNTIQEILNYFTNYIFLDKINTKYFLTIIGDIILKKNNECIYLVNNNSKQLLVEFDKHLYNFFKISNGLNQFKYKYYDHDYKLCKIINTNLLDKFSFKNINFLNILIVSIYYSNRHKNSNVFLLNNQSDTVKINYLLDKTPNIIVNDFLNKYTTNVNNNKINFKDMMYLWKLFLKNECIPNIIFSNNFKNILINVLEYNESENNFYNISSKYLPLVIKFNEFWNDNILLDNTNFNEYELDELLYLFKIKNHKLNINEVEFLELINHFYPDLEIENNKYILNIHCNLWNKQLEIENWLNYYKEKCKNENINYEKSIHNLYSEYLNYYDKNILKISKKYFNKFLQLNLSNYIIDNNVCPLYWTS
mgnify:CR=1 FL=1